MTPAAAQASTAADCVWAVIPAAGIGARMGAATPKQYLRIAGCTLIEHACAALLANSRVSGLVVALHAVDPMMAGLPLVTHDRVHLVVGGVDRADSVLAGLDYFARRVAPGDWVLVHDAARPCVATALVDLLLAELSQHAVGGIVALPVSDTVKQSVCCGEIDRRLPREQLWLAQTPQVFRYCVLVQALRRAHADGVAVTDESMALERLGYRPMLLMGVASNIKVTYPQDLALAAWYLANRSVV